MSDTSAEIPADSPAASIDAPDGATPPAASESTAETAAPAVAEVAAGAAPPAATLDLAEIERDLAAVEAALPRLDDGSYWVDEITGDEIPDAVLADNPVARRA